MMPIEVAIDIAFKRANQLGRKIEAIERNTRCMDWFSRSELGMLRLFLLDAGVSHDQLPEVLSTAERFGAWYDRWMSDFQLILLCPQDVLSCTSTPTSALLHGTGSGSFSLVNVRRSVLNG